MLSLPPPTPKQCFEEKKNKISHETENLQISMKTNKVQTYLDRSSDCTPVETVTSEVYLNIHSSFRKQLQCSEDIKNIQTNKTTKKPWLHSKIVFVRVGNQNNQNNNTRLYTFQVWKGSECSMKADESALE